MTDEMHLSLFGCYAQYGYQVKGKPTIVNDRKSI